MLLFNPLFVTNSEKVSGFLVSLMMVSRANNFVTIELCIPLTYFISNVASRRREHLIDMAKKFAYP